MTDEDAFQRTLDACPEDWQTRLVLADWLEDRGDVRAEGYRALGELQKCPGLYDGSWSWRSDRIARRSHPVAMTLDSDWFNVMGGPQGREYWLHNPTRREAEDAAALAFAELPAARRAELLAAAPV